MNKLCKSILVLICVISIVICAMSFGYLVIKKPKIKANDILNITIDDTSDRITKDENLNSFHSIKGNLKYTDVFILKGDKFKIHVDYNKKLSEINYKVDNGILEITENKEGNMSVVNFKGSTVKIYVPEESTITSMDMNIASGDFISEKLNFKNYKVINNYGDISINSGEFETINIQCKSGDIEGNNVKFKDATIVNSYGKIEMDNTEGNKLLLDNKSGNIELKNISVKDTLKVLSNYGDFHSESIEANNVDINLKSGNINIEKGKVFNSKVVSSYGNISFENNISQNKFNFNVKCKYGDITINDEDVEKEYIKNNGAQYSVEIESNSGDVDLQFK